MLMADIVIMASSARL